MTSSLGRATGGAEVTDEVFEAILGNESLNEIVVADVKAQNLTPSQVTRLMSDPWAWRDELIRVMQTTEQSLSSISTRISILSTHVHLADGDWDYSVELSVPYHQRHGGTNTETKYLQEIVEELDEIRDRRLNSLRFLHALQTKLVDVKAIIRSRS